MPTCRRWAAVRTASPVSIRIECPWNCTYCCSVVHPNDRSIYVRCCCYCCSESVLNEMWNRKRFVRCLVLRERFNRVRFALMLEDFFFHVAFNHYNAYTWQNSLCWYCARGPSGEHVFFLFCERCAQLGVSSVTSTRYRYGLFWINYCSIDAYTNLISIE